MQTELNDSNTPDSSDALETSAAKPKPVSSASEVRYLNSLHKRIVRSSIEKVVAMVKAGRKLTAIKKRLEAANEGRRGAWEAWVEENLDFDLRTAQRYMQAYSEQALFDPADPASFLARIYGNANRRKKKEGDVTSPSRKKDDDNQSGGPGFNPPFNPDRGKPSVAFFKRFAMQADTEFFGSPEYTDEAKLREAEELKRWIDHKVKIFSERISRKEEEQK